MFSVDDFVKDFRKECMICINLYRQIPAGGLDYRPSAKQRSTLELLRYLTYGPYNAIRRILIGDWASGRPTGEVTKDMPPSDFPERMLWQADEVERLVRGVPASVLETEEFKFPWGETQKKGLGIVSHPYKWLIGYRMQLFLYLKASGAALGTPDLWHLPTTAPTLNFAGKPAAAPKP